MSYTPEEERLLQELDAELAEAKLQNKQLANAQMSMFNSQEQESIVKWQLGLDEELDRIYHFLRGDVLKENDKGELIYTENDDDTYKPFNEHGIQLLMSVIKFYLNRNTILSNYDEETINMKMLDFQIELSDLIYMKYHEMGMNTEEKRRMYPIIIREIVDSVHSSYNRALHGMERTSLRKMMNISQSDNISNRMGNVPVVSQHKSGLSRVMPWNWGR